MKRKWQNYQSEDPQSRKDPLFFGEHHFSDVTAKSRLPDILAKQILVG
jgi:hypothetical protein